MYTHPSSLFWTDVSVCRKKLLCLFSYIKKVCTQIRCTHRTCQLKLDSWIWKGKHRCTSDWDDLMNIKLVHRCKVMLVACFFVHNRWIWIKENISCSCFLFLYVRRAFEHEQHDVILSQKKMSIYTHTHTRTQANTLTHTDTLC